MTKEKRALILVMNGFEVGKLSKSIHGTLSFQYDKKWLNTPGARPISRSLPLIDYLYTGEKVVNFFDNLLPP